MKYLIKINIRYDDFVKRVRNIHTCCAYIKPEGYIKITYEIIDKLKKGDLVITEYHDAPLGEVIYINAASNLN